MANAATRESRRLALFAIGRFGLLGGGAGLLWGGAYGLLNNRSAGGRSPGGDLAEWLILAGTAILLALGGALLATRRLGCLGSLVGGAALAIAMAAIEVSTRRFIVSARLHASWFEMFGISLLVPGVPGALLAALGAAARSRLARPRAAPPEPVQREKKAVM